MKRSLYFTGPRTVDVRSEPRPEPAAGDVAVESIVSAISAGTEGLLYRGEAPESLPADETIDALEEDLSYPLRYGYATVGRVTDCGEGVDDSWLERTVFAYRPHESHFIADPTALHPVPDDCPLSAAALLANAETAVNLVLDGAPTIGARVVVFGQGVVGLLTTALLARYPLESLVTVDYHERRRTCAEALGADRTVDPAAGSAADALEAAGGRADLTYELSGDPDALDEAIAATGYDGRVLVGSWYGTKGVDVDLGGRFHRDRLSIESSQVSTIAPEHRGRWSRERRHELAWDLVAGLEASSIVTHELPFERAAEAYELLDERPHEAIQVLLRYD